MRAFGFGGRKGQAMLFITLVMSVMMALGGLAVDLIFTYTVQARLGIATDSVALGISRALGRGFTEGEQQSEVDRVADLLFQTNFPTQFLLTGTSSRLIQKEVYVKDATGSGWMLTDPALPEGMRQVRITSEVLAPTFFMRMFGLEHTTVRSGAVAVRQDVNLVLVLDRSGSMVAASPPAWPVLQDAAKFFVSQFDISADRVGLVTFGGNADIEHSIVTQNPSPGGADQFKQTLLNRIDAHQPVGSDRTNLAMGLYFAYRDLAALNDPTALNAIVFFTDGLPTAFTTEFDVVTDSSQPDWVSDADGRIEAAVFAGQSSGPLQGVTSVVPLSTSLPINNPASGSDRWMHPGYQAGSGGALGYPGAFDSVRTKALLQPTATMGLRDWTPSTDPTVAWQASGATWPTIRVSGVHAGTSAATGALLVNGSSTQQWQNLVNASVHQSIDIANQARNNPDLPGMLVYGIGLGGYILPADVDFMKDIANDPDASYPDTGPNDPRQGIFVFAPTTAQLMQAFQSIQSEIFRLIF